MSDRFRAAILKLWAQTELFNLTNIITNLRCASRRRARSRCGSSAACTCPRPSPRCNGRRWPAASSLSWPAPPSAAERASRWRPGSSGPGWAPLDGEGWDTNSDDGNTREKYIRMGKDKRFKARKKKRRRLWSK